MMRYPPTNENFYKIQVLTNSMDIFEKEVRSRLKNYNETNKVYLKKNYQYELFQKHNISDDEINFIFDMKKIIVIYPNAAFSERIDIIINSTKGRRPQLISFYFIV